MAESLYARPESPALTQAGGDSIWACWVTGESPWELRARCRTGDTWRATESVLTESETELHWPDAVVGDSGRPMVACWAGDDPFDAHPTDTGAIYTVTRGPGGWEEPVLVLRIPWRLLYRLCLGVSNHGELGLVWDSNDGYPGGTNSVMYSRRTPTGWTERKRLAAGITSTLTNSDAALVAGDSNCFCVVFAHRHVPVPCSVIVVAVTDTVASAPTYFLGAHPALARDAERKLLVWLDQTQGDIVGAVDEGSGWGAPVAIAAANPYVRPALCMDSAGCGWTCWCADGDGPIMASYCRGQVWSVPETVGTVSSWSWGLRVATDGNGRVHCLWADSTTLKHAWRPGLQGVEEKGVARRGDSDGRLGRTILRGPELVRMGCRVVDIAGRDVTGRKERLSPGIYFVRWEEDNSTTKVVVQR